MNKTSWIKLWFCYVNPVQKLLPISRIHPCIHMDMTFLPSAKLRPPPPPTHLQSEGLPVPVPCTECSTPLCPPSPVTPARGQAEKCCVSSPLHDPTLRVCTNDHTMIQIYDRYISVLLHDQVHPLCSGWSTLKLRMYVEAWTVRPPRISIIKCWIVHVGLLQCLLLFGRLQSIERLLSHTVWSWMCQWGRKKRRTQSLQQ